MLYGGRGIGQAMKPAAKRPKLQIPKQLLAPHLLYLQQVWLRMHFELRVNLESIAALHLN